MLEGKEETETRKVRLQSETKDYDTCVFVFHVTKERFTLLGNVRESYTLGVLHKFPQVWPSFHLEGTCRCVFDGSKDLSPRNGQSNCRFARSTTYTRPTDVFLSLSRWTSRQFPPGQSRIRIHWLSDTISLFFWHFSFLFWNIFCSLFSHIGGIWNIWNRIYWNKNSAQEDADN